MVDHHLALQTFDTAADLHRQGDALAQGENVRPLRVGDDPRRYDDFGNAVEEICRYLVTQTTDHVLEIRKAHLAGARSWE
jgi:hypothetical protein